MEYIVIGIIGLFILLFIVGSIIRGIRGGGESYYTDDDGGFDPHIGD